MSGIKASTGLISGLDIGGIVDALINAERASARRLETKLTNTQSAIAGFGALQAQLLTLSTSVQTLSNRRTFTNLAIQNSAPEQLTIASKTGSIAGNYQFQSVQLVSSQRSLSRGFANAETQQFGTAGQLTITREGFLSRPTKLEVLNGAQGVRRGSIRVTDRSGASADVDLTNAVTVQDVVNAINGSGLGVTAKTVQGRIVLNDTTGQTTANLSVAELGSGHTAADLGIRQSVAATTLTGDDVFQVTQDFTYALLNDGNTLRNISGDSDLSISLADGTTLDVDLDGTATVGDALSKINDHESNGGKLVAELQNGRLVLTDTTSGSGTLTVTNLNNSNAKEVLGLAPHAVAGVITGQKLAAGANSALLRNLRGGRGIDQLGSISLTDRTGATATIDLSSAESLDDVLEAINTAKTVGDVSLQLSAQLNAQGDGIEVVDTSGATASNLIIADVGGSTVAADLGLTVDSAVSSIDSGALRLRTVNESTSLSTYSPRGTAVSQGSFRVTDSAGNQAVINVVSSATKTVGDVIDLINATSGIQVTARLNDTGDGIAIVDNAGGAGTFKIEEIGGKTAADLRLTGAAVVGSGGQQEIVSRRTLSIDVAATDTLNNIVSKLNLIGGTVRGSVVNSGAAVNGFRLSLTSTIAGESGRFLVEDGALEFAFTTQEQGHDAVLRVGSDPETGFLVSSNTNTFTNVIGNFDVTLKQVGTTAANVTATVDRNGIATALQGFATAYNAYIDLSTALTKYDTATQTRAALQGTTAPLTIQTRFNSLINSLVGNAGESIRSLADAGLTTTSGGKLTFDVERLNSALDTAPDRVLELFANIDTGFGVRFNKALDGFTDQFEGSLTLQTEALQNNADSLTSRIADIDARLAIRRTRLELQFANLETVLSGLQSQQTSLTNLANTLSSLNSSSS